MSFTDLPAGWDQQSLRDPRLASDVVDLLCRHGDRLSGCLYVLACDVAGRMVQPVLVQEVPSPCDDLEKVAVLWNLTAGLQGAGPWGGGNPELERAGVSTHVGALALGVGRRGRSRVGLHDRGWATALAAACQDHRLENLGCYVATPGRVVPVDAEPVMPQGRLR